MKVEFDKSFERSHGKIHDPGILQRLERIITHLEISSSLSQEPNIKKLSGYSNYFRLRIGDYRVGFELINRTTIRFIIIAHRKDIYKIFP
jgi:mRNA interferase RelE/StbE